jgi:hypothetical protein
MVQGDLVHRDRVLPPHEIIRSPERRRDPAFTWKMAELEQRRWHIGLHFPIAEHLNDSIVIDILHGRVADIHGIDEHETRSLNNTLKLGHDLGKQVGDG